MKQNHQTHLICLTIIISSIIIGYSIFKGLDGLGQYIDHALRTINQTLSAF